MRHERIKVKRDNNTVHNLTIAPWEIPVIEYLFDEGNVERLGQFVTLDREYPDPREEMQRLEKAYGADVQTNVPFAVSVYGAMRTGVRVLAKAIEAAREEEEEEDEETEPLKPAPKPLPPRKPARSSRSAAADPLLA
jgi:hypothetical protein